MSRPLNIPGLTTRRLRLEPLSTDHASGMFRLWSDPEVCRYSGVVRDYAGNSIDMPAATSAESDLIVDFWIRAARDGWGFRWAVMIADGNGFAGTVGFNTLTDCAEIAYHLLPDYWGRGVMNEACQAAIDWRRGDRGSGIEALIEPDNSASIALVRRLGLSPTGEFSEGSQRYRMSLQRTYSGR